MVTYLMTSFVRADPPGDPAAVSSEDGKYADKDGNPTYKVDKDGKVDFYSYIGFVRYAANCLQCHGPDGLGSTYAPSLVDSLKTLNYGDFLATVAGGKKDVSDIAATRHARARRKQERHVLYRCDLYLSAGTFHRCDRSRTSRGA